MDNIDERLDELLAQNPDPEPRIDIVEEVIEEPKNAQSEPSSEPENKATALTVQEMSYDQVQEFAKKSNLVATSKDKNFVAELSEMNKDVLKESIALEKERIALKNKELELEKTKIDTEKEKSTNERLREGFGAKLDAQEYHYKSLRPILETVGIKTPMNIIFMWVIAIGICIIPIYPVKLLVCATIGQLIAGANNENRKGFAKGVLWTSVVVIGIALMALVVFGIIKLGVLVFG